MKEDDIRQRSTFNKFLKILESDAEKISSFREKFNDTFCPGCECQNGEFQFVKWGFKYLICNKCGSLFASPRPAIEVLSDFYRNSPSASYWSSVFFPPVAEARRIKIFSPRAQYIANRFRNVVDNGIVGDIGAGFGIFLEELGKICLNANLVAIEPSLQMASICESKGLQVIPHALEDIDSTSNYFDLLVAFELLEHVYDPKIFLTSIFRLLKPGGVAFLTTLNAEGFDIQIYWERSKSITPPQHLNFLTPRAAEMLLLSIGFEVLEISTPGLLDWDIVEGAWLQEALDPGRFWRTVACKNEDCKQQLQQWIIRNDLSSHMRILARKPC